MTDSRPGYSRIAPYGDYFGVVADPSAPEPKKAKINVLAIARIGMSRSAIESAPADQARDHAGHLGPAATPAPSATVGCARPDRFLSTLFNCIIHLGGVVTPCSWPETNNDVYR
jgi:hypothetical protein